MKKRQKNSLTLLRRVALTEEAHKFLKQLRRRRKQSMASIVCDLIFREYGQHQ